MMLTERNRKRCEGGRKGDCMAIPHGGKLGAGRLTSFYWRGSASGLGLHGVMLQEPVLNMLFLRGAHHSLPASDAGVVVIFGHRVVEAVRHDDETILREATAIERLVDIFLGRHKYLLL